MASSLESLAFVAGMYAFFNPCGIAMLPSYISFYIEKEASSANAAGKKDSKVRTGLLGLAEKLWQGIVLGSVVSLGFLVLFGITGVAISFLGTYILSIVPWLAILIGMILVVFGIAWLRGKDLPLFYSLDLAGAKLKNSRLKSKYASYFAYGVGYGIASISCTIPVFLALVLNGVSRGGVVSGTRIFIMYGLGMSVVMIAVSLATALFKETVIKFVSSALPYVKKIGGAVLIAAGFYIVYYQINALNVLYFKFW